MQTEHNGIAGVSPEVRNGNAPADPIITAIAAYRAGMAAYGEVEDESDEWANRTYGPPLDVIVSWKEPAQTHEGACEALRLATQELEMGFYYSALPMVRAALAFIEGDA